MRHTRIAFAALLLLGTASSLQATNHMVTVGGVYLQYTPSSITIQAGDTVTWTNSGGMHSVLADDGSFSCAHGCVDQGGDGTPSTDHWTSTRTFNTPALIGYHCGYHGYMMHGTITVQGAMSPGQIRFSTGSVDVGEAGGMATLSVQRVNGTAGAVSVQYSTLNGTAMAGQDFTAVSGTLSWADQEAAPKTISIPITFDPNPDPTESFIVALSNPTGGATIVAPSSETVNIIDTDGSSGGTGIIAYASATVSVLESDGNAVLNVVRSGGTTGQVTVDYATAAGTAEEGVDFVATSGTLVFPDGDAGPHSIQVPLLVDAVADAPETFTVGLGNATGGAALGSPATATVTIADNAGPQGPCVPDATTLCLRGTRFLARLSWTDFHGQTRDAFAVPFTSTDTGFFYFLDPNDLEVIVKVLNGCAFNGDYWVFLAAATNVGYTLTVEDTSLGVFAGPYTNVLGSFSLGVGDTTAFPNSCP